jgi:sugar lactone lactonase YvrE
MAGVAFVGVCCVARQMSAQSVYTPYSFVTIAGSGYIGSSDGIGYAASFYLPSAIAVDRAGNSYVADTDNNMIRKIGPGGIVTTLAGSTNAGSADGTGSAAEFNFPAGVAVDNAGNVYVADGQNYTIRQITAGGVVTTLAGQPGYPGSADGTGSAAQFGFPRGIAVDSVGNMYVADDGNNTIRVVTPGGAVKTLAGLAGTSGSGDGTGTDARFNGPNGIAVDSAGNVYVADMYNHTIRKVSPGGAVTTLAGLAGSGGSDDGVGSAARFYYPAGVAVDGKGNVFVADSYNFTIRMVTPAGVVTTLGGAPGTDAGYARDGAGYSARFRIPQGVAVDSAGNLFIADYFNCSVSLARPVVYTPYTFTTLAGSTGYGSGDGIGRAAQFNQPWGVAVDAAGNVYVTDYGNFTIRKVTPRGVVTTMAGIAGIPARSTIFGYLSSAADADGTGNDARFGALIIDPFFGYQFTYGPEGIAADPVGNLYVADTYNGTIRKITAAGVVTTFAGLAGSYGALDGVGSAARFYSPSAIATDSAGNVYVADEASQLIRKVSAAGVVKTLAGMAMSAGSADGTNSTARFNHPAGIAVDGSGTIYVADRYSHTIRKVTPAGVVTTLAGLAANPGNVDGTGSAARFYYPMGLAVDSAKNVYVADGDNSTIRKITPTGVVTTLAGSTNYGSADGVGSAAQFDFPSSVAVDSAGNVYVADQYNNTIRKVTPGGAVTTLAGLAGGGYGSTDGAQASFNNPIGVAADAAGNVYVADTDNHTIRRVAPDGFVTTVAGMPGNAGSDNGTNGAARFYDPAAVTMGPDGNLYVADTDNQTIRRVSPDGVVRTVAGQAGYSGNNDGTGIDAHFYNPYGITTDGTNLYVADTYNNTIRRVTLDGVVTTLAGLAGSFGTADGTGSAARFSSPNGVAADSAGNIYVADFDYGLIRKVSQQGVVTTLAGCATCPYYGSLDGTGTNALFNSLQGIAVDGAGNVFVSDFYDFSIRRVTPSGQVTTVAGLAGNWGSADGTASAAQFGGSFFNGFFYYTEGPAGLAVDNAGNLYVADPINNTIRAGSPLSQRPVIGSAGPGSGIYGGQFGFILKGPEGKTAVIEASTDLTHWQPLLTNTFAAPLDFSDPQSHLFSKRFYRARIE